MKRILVSCLVLAFWVIRLTGQSNIPIDTTYTVISSYHKSKIEFPFISIAHAQVDDNIINLTDIVYQQYGDRKLVLDAFYDKQSVGLKPAIILVHGGGWRSGNKSHMYPMALELAKRGYICFTPEYRLSAEVQYPGGIIDIKYAIKYLRNNAGKYNIDPTKIVLLGCSAGGQMAGLIGVNNPIIDKMNPDAFAMDAIEIAAVVNCDGVLAYIHPESKERDAASLWLGSYEERPENWHEASAICHADNKAKPVLFINSSIIRFHAGRDDMIEILNNHNIYSKVVNMPTTPHTFWLFNPWFDQTLDHIDSFLIDLFR